MFSLKRGLRHGMVVSINQFNAYPNFTIAKTTTKRLWMHRGRVLPRKTLQWKQKGRKHCSLQTTAACTAGRSVHKLRDAPGQRREMPLGKGRNLEIKLASWVRSNEKPGELSPWGKVRKSEGSERFPRLSRETPTQKAQSGFKSQTEACEVHSVACGKAQAREGQDHGDILGRVTAEGGGVERNGSRGLSKCN